MIMYVNALHIINILILMNTHVLI